MLQIIMIGIIKLNFDTFTDSTCLLHRISLPLDQFTVSALCIYSYVPSHCQFFLMYLKINLFNLFSHSSLTWLLNSNISVVCIYLPSSQYHLYFHHLSWILWCMNFVSAIPSIQSPQFIFSIILTKLCPFLYF